MHAEADSRRRAHGPPGCKKLVEASHGTECREWMLRCIREPLPGKVGPAYLDLLFAASDIDVATEDTVHRHASRHQELKDAATRQPTAPAVNRAEAAPKS